ncbi:hypothetical protein OC842_003558 [Tilletia horrida]|uniref:Uncharacterized protein n=1 Tax=Tilletia horrida TaxID=155126 RepID=A0AAN6GB81_9BASI|nr:hypothetical protein OC842_003558 [Tilletia horrida]
MSAHALVVVSGAASSLQRPFIGPLPASATSIVLADAGAESNRHVWDERLDTAQTVVSAFKALSAAVPGAGPYLSAALGAVKDVLGIAQKVLRNRDACDQLIERILLFIQTFALAEQEAGCPILPTTSTALILEPVLGQLHLLASEMKAHSESPTWREAKEHDKISRTIAHRNQQVSDLIARALIMMVLPHAIRAECCQAQALHSLYAENARPRAHGSPSFRIEVVPGQVPTARIEAASNQTASVPPSEEQISYAGHASPRRTQRDQQQSHVQYDEQDHEPSRDSFSFVALQRYLEVLEAPLETEREHAATHHQSSRHHLRSSRRAPRSKPYLFTQQEQADLIDLDGRLQRGMLHGHILAPAGFFADQDGPAAARVRAQDAIMLLGRLRKHDESSFQRHGIQQITKLGLRLQQLDLLEERVMLLQILIALCERKTAQEPNIFYRSYAAKSWLSLSEALFHVGRWEEALSCAERSRELLTKLALMHNASLAPVAQALRWLGYCSLQLGHTKDALRRTRESLEMIRLLVAEHPGAYEADLASTLCQYAWLLVNQHRWSQVLWCHPVSSQESEARTAIEECIGIQRRLFEADQATHGPPLAKALNVYATVLYRYEDRHIALSVMEECLRIHQSPEPGRALINQIDVIRALRTFSMGLRRARRYTAALSHIQESHRRSEVLYQSRPETYGLEFAYTLADHAELLRLSEDPKYGVNALRLRQKSVRLVKALYEQRPAVYKEHLATFLEDFNDQRWSPLQYLGPSSELLSILTATISSRSNSTGAAPSEPLGSQSRSPLAFPSPQEGPEEFLTAQEHNIQTTRNFCLEHPEQWLVARSLAQQLLSYSRLFGKAGKTTKALHFAQEAMQIHAHWARKGHAEDTALVDTSFYHARLLGDTGQYKEAIVAIDELVAIVKNLLVESPDANPFGFFLQWKDLEECFFVLSSAGYHDQAVAINKQLLAAIQGLKESSSRGAQWTMLDAFEMHAGWLRRASRPADALPALRAEIAYLQANLAEVGTNVLTQALRTYTNTLIAADRHTDAIAASEGVLKTCRQFYTEHPQRGFRALTALLKSHATLLDKTGQRRQALEYRQELAEVLTTATKEHSASYSESAIQALEERAYILHDAGKHVDAVAETDKAIELRRRFAKQKPGTSSCEETVASLLSQCSRRLSQAGLHELAVDKMNQGLALRKAMYAEDPMQHANALIGALTSSSELLAQAGRQSDRIIIIEERLNLLRRLHAEEPLLYPASAVAEALSDYSQHLAGAGRISESVAALRERVAICRLIHKEGSESNSGYFLALAIGSLSEGLMAAKLSSDALLAKEESLTLLRACKDGSAALAEALRIHSTMLASMSRYPEALAAAQKSVGIYRQLQEKHPRLFDDELSTASIQAGDMMMACGQRAEALRFMQEAFGLLRLSHSKPYRQAFSQHDALIKHPRMLVSCLSAYSEWLGKIGEHTQALGPMKECLAIHKDMEAQGLATSGQAFIRDLYTYAQRLRRAGRSADAVLVSGQCLDFCRRKHAEDPLECPQSLISNALAAHSDTLHEQRRYVEALSAAQERIEVIRERQQGDPRGTSAEALAGALGALASRLHDVGRSADGLSTIEESLALSRQHTAAKAGLARLLTRYSRILGAMSRRIEGRSAVEKSVSLLRSLRQVSWNRYEDDLVDALIELSSQLAAAGSQGPALQAIEESLELLGPLHAIAPGDNEGRMSRALMHHAKRLTNVGRHEDALPQIEEALRRCRALHERRPVCYEGQLFQTLITYWAVLKSLERHEDALNAGKEALDLCRIIHQYRPARFRARLLKAMSAYAAQLKFAGRVDEASALDEEAASLSQTAL